MQRVVHLSEGRMITLAQYVEAVRRAKAMPDATFRRGFTGWWPVTGREVLQDWWCGVQERINSAIPRSAEWGRPAPQPEGRSPEERLLHHLQKEGRDCRECGEPFRPRGVWDRLCPSCRGEYTELTALRDERAYTVSVYGSGFFPRTRLAQYGPLTCQEAYSRQQAERDRLLREGTEHFCIEVLKDNKAVSSTSR